MLSLFRFALVVALIAGLAFAGMDALQSVSVAMQASAARSE
jgi:hypothetical protein